MAGFPGRTLPAAFYARDTLVVARELLGALLCRRSPDGEPLWGRIVETEAYVGESDPACHGAAGLTPRTRVLYGPPGRTYVYLNYGVHYLLNAVTEREGFPAAVLIRAIHPGGGLDRMQANRRGKGGRLLTAGPGRLTQALGIRLEDNDRSLGSPSLQIRSDGAPGERVACGPRIGIRKGLERPWRFWLSGDPYVSQGPAPETRGTRGTTRNLTRRIGRG